MAFLRGEARRRPTTNGSSFPPLDKTMTILCVGLLLSYMAMVLYHIHFSQRYTRYTYIPMELGAWPTRKHRNITLDGVIHEYSSVWIHVKTFAEGIGGWRKSIAELLRLARLLNYTIVEPCMSNGRLQSCSLNHGIPISKVFDLSDALRPSNKHPFPILAPYKSYWRHVMAATLNTTHNMTEFNICMTSQNDAYTPAIMAGTKRCSKNTSMLSSINMKQFQNIITSATGTSNFVVINLENYWRQHGDSMLTLLGGDATGTIVDKLSFHPSHVKTVENILLMSNITEENYSIIHWRAEKDGMDYMECAKAVLNAKYAIENMTTGHHPFILLTSLNRNESKMWTVAQNRSIVRPWSTIIQSLDFLSDHSIQKFDELMNTQDRMHNYDSEMLAVYDLILAMKARIFATCAKQGKHGCSIKQAVNICKKCNHSGKFGQLAISLRESLAENSSWGCWPQAPKGFIEGNKK